MRTSSVAVLRIIVVSMEGLDDAKKTQEQFPHLVVLADEGRGLSEALALVHAKAAPSGNDADMPTTILVDLHGIVRWIYRPGEVVTRLSPENLLKAIDTHLPKSSS